MLAKLKGFLGNKQIATFIFISVGLALNTLFYLDQKTSKILIVPGKISMSIFNFLFFFFLVITVSNIIYFYKRFSALDILGKLLLAYLPTEIIIILGLERTSELNAFFGFASAFYILIATSYLTVLHFQKSKKSEASHEKNDQPHWLSAIILTTIIALNLFFGAIDIGKFSAVDEPLWTFDRIPNFWRDALEHDWIGSRVSDKPGLTVALISGTGLFFETNPKQFKEMPWRNNQLISQQEIEKFNFTFRFPLFLFASLSLLGFYFLIKNLADQKSALVASIFIGLSPILIGNARIINPDGLLWIFTTFSILSFLIYLTQKKTKFLYLAGFTLGLSILTKYVANILFVFFFGLIFLEYIFTTAKQNQMDLRESFKKHLLDYLLMIIIAISTFYVLYPAVWGKPDRVLLGTIQSQAFAPIWPLFATIIALVLADLALFKNIVFEKIVLSLSKYKKLIFSLIVALFLVSIAFTLINTYSDMRLVDVEEALASPKSSFEKIGPLGFFMSNFYPLVFGISPLIILAVFLFSLKNIFSSDPIDRNNRSIIYLIIFILLYYLGSTVSQVASVIRYQVMLYPIILIVGTLSIFSLLKNYSNQASQKIAYLSLLLALPIFSVLTLASTKPFFEDYASILLPSKYYINLKDMGSGSYEAAQYLNSLPEAEKLQIWTDKQGVCTFFRGACSGTFSLATLNNTEFDYFVVSSGRESRTTKININRLIRNKTFNDIYDNETAIAYKIELGDRPNNFVKIIDAKKLFE